MKNNINQRAIAASLGHTQFETYTDEHRKEYVIADNSLNEDIYERGIETNVGDLMYGATKEAKDYLIWPKLKRLLHKPAKNVYRMQSLQRFNIFTSLDVKLGYIDSEKY